MHESSYLYASADTITIVSHILFKTYESKKLFPCNIKSMIHEKKLTSWTSLKLKNSALRLSRRWEYKPQTGRKYFQRTYLIKDCHPKYCTELNKKMNTPIKWHATTNEAPGPRAQAPQWKKPPQWEAHAKTSHHLAQLDKARTKQWKPSTAKSELKGKKVGKRL